MRHDYRTAKSEKGVELIVRPRNTYGSAGAGEVVLVDARELLNGSTRSACMTQDEAAELQRRIEEAEREAEAKRRVASRRTITAAITEGLSRLGKKDAGPGEASPEANAAAEAAAKNASDALVEVISKSPTPDDEAELPTLGGKKKKAKRD